MPSSPHLPPSFTATGTGTQQSSSPSSWLPVSVFAAAAPTGAAPPRRQPSRVVVPSISTSENPKLEFVKALAVDLAVSLFVAGLSYIIIGEAIKRMGSPGHHPSTAGASASDARNRLLKSQPIPPRPAADKNSSNDPAGSDSAEPASWAVRVFERRLRATFDTYEDSIAGDMVFADGISETFADVGGLTREKEEIYDLVVLPLKAPALFHDESNRSKLTSTPKGILLYGPPGTGKSMIAKAIAKESGAAFINLKMSTTMNMYLGESQKLVRAAFSLAHKLRPSIIFIDEIDSFLRQRRGDDNESLGNMKAEFLALWDGVANAAPDANGDDGGVIVLGATNRPWAVDPAVLRRMPRTFEISMPDASARLNILQIVLEHEKVDPLCRARLPELAASLEGYSGSDVKELCRTAAMRPFRDFARSAGRQLQGGASAPKQKSQVRPMTWADFMYAKGEVKPTGETAFEYMHNQQRGAGGRASYTQFEGASSGGAPHGGDPLSGLPTSDSKFLAGVRLGMAIASSSGANGGMHGDFPPSNVPDFMD